MTYEAVIGLEVHVQVRTASKMFCSCRNAFGGDPNTHVCPVCLGYPGVLPVPNREAIRKTIAAGLMCGSRIAEFSKFDRKNYYYPDMPKNYQISQYDLPFCEGGHVQIGGEGFSGAALPDKAVGITRIHLEEDVAKSTHFPHFSGIDFNRAGVPLMEIVSEPDMRSADEAYAYLVALRETMQYADVGDCDMEKGQMRSDVNISLRPVGQAAFGEKVEIKNLNSFRAVHRSIEYEIERQAACLDEGEPIRQETRRWDDALGVTSVMRTKENAHDYRYFPEPDLLPVVVDRDWLERIREGLPETPAARRERFVDAYGITAYDARVLTQDRALADYFEDAARAVKNPKTAANWIMTELLRELGERGLGVEQSPIPSTGLAELVRLIEDRTISGKIAKTVFAEMLEHGGAPAAIVKAKGLVQVTDTDAIAGFVDRAMADNPGPVEEYRAGNTKAIQFLVGQVMKASRGKANPQSVVALLKERLDG
jgi:aspartyl-tRNA(Asn)/glutamyl-tRNA(Gln) amidotransferase subunit B